MQDSAHILQAQVNDAVKEQRALAICGGGSKQFYGRQVSHDRLDTRIHAGITEYSPTELVLTARAGTPLAEIEATLLQNDQMLGCEPPMFGEQATFGGMLATGLSGPSRPYRAAVQDTVLGCTILNGNGEILRFGGKVMKNVAGYDVSRLMVGSLGCLGVILEATVKVVPRSQAQLTVAFAIGRDKAGALVNDMRRQGLPVTADCHDGDRLLVRFSAGEKEVARLPQQLAQHYSFVDWHRFEDDAFWGQLKNHQLPFFTDGRDVWRLSVPATADISSLSGRVHDVLSEWGGCLHWLKAEASAESVFAAMEACNGHASLFRQEVRRESVQVFQPLHDWHMNWHRRLKTAFDPVGILNPGRMYADL